MKSAAGIALLLFAFSAFAQQPSTADEWFALGTTRNSAGDFRGAAEAFEKARSLGYLPRPAVNLRIAGAWAHAGDKDRAFKVLQQMADGGFGPPDQLLAADDLVALRSDPRWHPLVEQMNHNGHPCRYSPEFRQFDYWLGEWDVLVGGHKVAQSSVQLILDECVIFENYSNSLGYAGKSFSLWDAASQKWEQRYVDTTGALHHWTGQMEDGTMIFYWTYSRNGATTTQRMKYLREGPDQVRQVIDSSTDGGKSWASSFNGLYVRRK